MQLRVEAYLDIETTGLSALDSEITVVGIHHAKAAHAEFTQLVGKDVSARRILATLRGADTLYTYNGSRFDLPFIHSRLGVDLSRLFIHRDLMYDCWRRNLYGGFKAVERRLGIERRLTGVDGYEAIRLWWRYIDYHDLNALNRLLEYNREDVVNLRTLKERLLQPDARER